MLTLRASSLPLLMTCPNAVLNPDGLPSVETENEAAEVGTLVHAVAERLAKTGEWTPDTLAQRLTGTELDRGMMLANHSLTVYQHAKRYMKEPVAEQALLSSLYRGADLAPVADLTGHLDLSEISKRKAFIIDYKTGRQHENHYHQMAAYAFLAWCVGYRHHEFTARVTAIYLEDNTVQHYAFTAGDLNQWEQEVVDAIQKPQYVVGRKCGTCKLLDACPAFRAYGAAGYELLKLDPPTFSGWQELTPEQRGACMDQVYAVEKAIGRLKLSLRSLVRATGAVDVGGGKEFAIVEQEEKQLNTAKALPILLEKLGSAALTKHTRFPLEAVLSEYAQKAARGQKARAKTDLFNALDEAGAIVRGSTEKMWRRPKDEQTLKG